MSPRVTTSTPTTPEERGQRITQLREAAGLQRPRDLAEQLGVDAPYVYKIEKGQVDPLKLGAERFLKLASIFKLSPAHLLAILTGTPHHDAPHQDSVRFTPERAIPNAGHANAGPTIDPTSDGRLVLPAHLSRPGQRYVTVEGNSMLHPTKRGIKSGDTVIVDTTDLRPQDGKVFVIQSAQYGTCVKRLRNLNGTWWAMSDNPEYGPFPLEPDDAEIIGRVTTVLELRDVE